MTVYDLQDPLPLIFSSDKVDECSTEDFIEYTDDGRIAPEPCIICGAPYCACTTNEGL